MTTSTINTNNPAGNTPVAASVVRQNFQAAASDINDLWAAVTGLVTGVSSFNGRTGAIVLEDTDIIDALGYNPNQKAGYFEWVNPVNFVWSLVPYAQYNFTIARMNALSVSSGSLNLTVAINGTPVTGLDTLSVTTSPLNPTATGANTVVAGNEVTLTITNSIGAANLKFSMLTTI